MGNLQIHIAHKPEQRACVCRSAGLGPVLGL